jgi:VWFA-related protein
MSFHGLRLLAGVAAACAAAAVLTAQQQQPVFRSGVELVQIDAVVTDRQNRPIGGLTAADFSVFENGRRQTIADFRPVSVAAATRPLDPKLSPAAFVANDEPLNRRLFVFVVDNLHITPSDMPRLRRVATALLAGLSADDQVAVVTTAPSEAGLDLTADPVLQARAMAQLQANAGTPWGFRAQLSERLTFDVLENVVAGLARSRHARRVVLYFSPATVTLPWLDQNGTITLLREGFMRTADAARHANVAVYAINPGGIDGSGFDAMAGDLHDEFARYAGGRGFSRWSDEREVVRQILADNATFYVLSYYRDPANIRDGQPAIEVRSTRPGLSVRARRGYVADPSAGPALATLSTALSEALPLDGIRLRASVTPGTPAPGERVTTNLTLEVTYPAEPGVTRVADELEFGVAALDYDARVIGTLGRVIAVDTPSTGAETRHVIRESFDLPPGPAVVRLGVSSKTLGRVGTVHVPVRIPKKKP